AEESGTPVREIDKALKAEAEKEESDLPADVIKAWNEAQTAYETYRKNVDAARNAYRKDVLGEEEKQDTSGDIDKDKLKSVRKAVLDALTFVKGYAEVNGMTDVLSWVDSVAVPQVGRQGTTSTG